MKDPNANRPGYKETKIGWIPKEWQCSELMEIADSSRSICYGVVQTGASIDEGVACVRVLDLVEGHLNPNKMIKTSHEINRQYKRTILKTGDLIFALRGDVGKVIMTPPELQGSNLTRGVALIPTEGKWNSRFIKDAIESDSVRSIIRLNVNGTALKEIPIEPLKKIPIPLPPLPEQKRIAEILSTSDDAISKTEQLIKAKQRQKKALMQQLLTGKKRLPGFEAKWRDRRISSVLSHVFRPVEWAGDKVFHLVSVRRRSMGLFRRKPLLGNQYKTKDLHELREGDFIVSKRQVTHGALAMVTRQFDGCHVSKEYSISRTETLSLSICLILIGCQDHAGSGGSHLLQATAL